MTDLRKIFQKVENDTDKNKKIHKNILKCLHNSSSKMRKKGRNNKRHFLQLQDTVF